MIKADLHIHSSISDGSDTIEEIIKKAEEKGLNCIAITDHDTCSHFMKLTTMKQAVKVLPGIEVSAIDRKMNIKAHILGYHIQNPSLVEGLTEPILNARHQNSLAQIQKLKDVGYYIDIDQINRADGKYIYKQHILSYLVETAQIVQMYGVFYKTVFKNGGFCDTDIHYVDVIEAVKTIKAAGGKAVLAHPGQQQNMYLIPELVRHGLDGIEYNHIGNSPEDCQQILEYAKEYNLFLTGGSDYHGKLEAEKVEIGEFLSEESGVTALCLE